jgi:hypothetical protein
VLKAAVQAHQLWQLSLKKSKGIKVSKTKLMYLSKEADLQHDTSKLTLKQIIQG